jgi:hypothetical protein
VLWKLNERLQPVAQTNSTRVKVINEFTEEDTKKFSSQDWEKVFNKET